MDIDGDEFAEADYGLVVDNSNGTQDLNSKLDSLAQAALQNQTLSFSTIMKLFSSASLAEKQRLVEKDERALQERQAQAQQEQNKLQQQQLEQNAQLEQAKMEQEDALNQRDNETKILVAEINANSKAEAEVNEEPVFSEESKAKLMESIRQFDERLKLDKDKLEFDKTKHKEDNQLKDTISMRQLKNRSNSSSNTK